MADRPSFWIHDGCAPDGRDHLVGIATGTTPAWWDSEFGRLYGGRGGDWGATDFSGDVPVSLAYRDQRAGATRAWFLLGARGTIAMSDGAAMRSRRIEVTGALRRIRLIGDVVVAVGARGQVLRGRDLALKPVAGLADPARFLVDVVGRGADDFTVVGRRGEVFHWDGRAWAAWSLGGGDLHVACLDGDAVVVGGDDGRLAIRTDAGAWRAVPVPTRDPIVGVCRAGDALWAATPTAVFTGDREGLAAVDGPGFGGQLAYGDGVLYLFGAAAVARFDGATWSPIEHPDQHYRGAPPAWCFLGASLDAAAGDPVDPAAELGGRLFAADDITAADVARWATLSRRGAQVREFLADPGMYRVLEVEGDLHVRGDLSTFARKLVGLVVHGNLIVDGVFSDNDHPRTLTLVGGELRAGTIWTSGQLEVRGATTCDHLMGDYNDYGAELHGPVRARLFWPEHHSFRLGSTADLGLCIGDSTSRVNREARAAAAASSPSALRAALRPELLRGSDDDELEVDRKATITALRSGASIWRKPKPKPKPKR